MDQWNVTKSLGLSKSQAPLGAEFVTTPELPHSAANGARLKLMSHRSINISLLRSEINQRPCLRASSSHAISSAKQSAAILRAGTKNTGTINSENCTENRL